MRVYRSTPEVDSDSVKLIPQLPRQVPPVCGASADGGKLAAVVVFNAMSRPFALRTAS